MLRNLITEIFKSTPSVESRRSRSEYSETCTVVTTMSEQGFFLYGKDFVSSFINHWPLNYSLEIYTEGFKINIDDERITQHDLHTKIPKLNLFKERHKNNQLAQGIFDTGYNYRFDASRFSNKVYVIHDAIENCQSKYLIWLDADTRTFLDVPRDFAARVLHHKAEIAYLGRLGMHMEGGFIAFDAKSQNIKSLCETAVAAYDNDIVFSYSEWNDCAIFDALRFQRQIDDKLNSLNLSSFQCAHPFVNSIPGLFMDHNKGPERKKTKSSFASDYLVPPPQRTNFYGGRYSQLVDIIKKYQPKTIIEIGTWSGWRAVQMCSLLLQHGLDVHYKGYDVFESGSSELDKNELNVKPHYSEDQVHKLLLNLQKLYPKFTFELIVGETKKTLSHQRVDFAFIDGGHSVDTIDHDFNCLRDCRLIVLDDYYSGAIDTYSYGCNQVIKDERFILLPIRDPVSGGGFTQFALIENT